MLTATTQESAVLNLYPLLHACMCCSVSYHAIQYAQLLCHAILSKRLLENDLSLCKAGCPGPSPCLKLNIKVCSK